MEDRIDGMKGHLQHSVFFLSLIVLLETKNCAVGFAGLPEKIHNLLLKTLSLYFLNETIITSALFNSQDARGKNLSINRGVRRTWPNLR